MNHLKEILLSFVFWCVGLVMSLLILYLMSPKVAGVERATNLAGVALLIAIVIGLFTARAFVRADHRLRALELRMRKEDTSPSC